jgi:hypothetical protein
MGNRALEATEPAKLVACGGRSIPDAAYEFEVGVVGTDNVLRKTNRTFKTLKDPACQQAPLIGRRRHR